MTEREVRALLRQKIHEAGSQLAFARLCRVTPQYLTDVLKGRRPLSAKILKQLGYQRIHDYRAIA